MRHSIPSLLLLAALANASPTSKNLVSVPLTKKGSATTHSGVANIGSLKTHLVAVENKYNRNLDAYQVKTGVSHPSKVTARKMKRNQVSPDGSNPPVATSPSANATEGTDPLTDDDDLLWQGPISVGNPPVDFTVDFDTGSSDLFLPSTLCTDGTCAGHTLYDPTKSSKAQDANSQFQLAFGDGSTVEGEAFVDTVTVAGLTADAQVLGAASTYSEGFEAANFPPDGLMGLGWPAIAQLNATEPFVNTLINNGIVQTGAFGVKLAENGSELTIGGIDPAFADAEFAKVGVVQQAFWQVKMDSADIGGQPAVENIQAIIDTGTTLVIGTTEDVTAFYAAIEGSQDASATIGSGFFTFPCDSAPQVALTFEGQSFDFTPSFSLGQVEEGSSDCVGGVVGADIGIDAWIVGDVFLTNVYAVFSFDESTVAFAKQT